MMGGFTCLCEAFYNGPKCENKLDPCKTKPCLSGERCILDSSYPLLYRCQRVHLTGDKQFNTHPNRTKMQGQRLMQSDLELFDYNENLQYDAFNGKNCASIPVDT